MTRPHENSVDNMRGVTEKLLEIKNYHLIRTALEIAKKVTQFTSFFPLLVP